MTNEEYLKRYYQELQNVESPEEDTETKETDFLEDAKKYLKHAAAGAVGAIPGAYLLNGGESVGPAILSGAAAATLKHALSDSDNIGSSIFTGLGVGTIAGAKGRIDSLAKENLNYKEQLLKKNMESKTDTNESFSDMKEFFSSYSPEGIKNFSEKLHNFMALAEIGGFNAMKDAPEGEKIRYATHGSLGGITGGVSGGLLGTASGVSSGFAAGLVSGHSFKDRLAKGVMGAIAGGTALGTSGGIIGAKLGSDQSVKMLKEQKINKVLKKASLNKYLTQEEKNLLERYIASKNRKKALEYAKDLMNEETNFSETNENFGGILKNGWEAIKSAKRGIDAGAKKVGEGWPKGVESYFQNHPKQSLGIKAGGVVAASVVANETPHFIPGGKDRFIGISDKAFWNINPNPFSDSSKIISSVGGAGLGALINQDDPIVGGITGGIGGIVGSLATGALGAKSDAAKIGIGLGAGALTSYLASKLMKKKKENEQFNSFKKRRVGRPSKQDVEEGYPYLLASDSD